MAAGLNIAALAQRTGVRPDTLRKWEHRYGVLQPDRTGGGQRRYSERDVARVEWLKARLGEGYRIGEAAALLGSAGIGISARTPEELEEQLYDAVRRSDAAALPLLVEQALSVLPIERALGEVIAPLLRRVGDGWVTGELSVAQEHLVSGAVRSYLERLLADARGDVRGTAVLACAPGELHELGLLMLAVLLRADGWQVAYLGGNTPLADATGLAKTLQAELLCLSATMPESRQAIDGLDAPLGTRLVLGGPAVDGEHELAAVVAGLRKG